MQPLKDPIDHPIDPLEHFILEWPGDPECDVHVYLAATKFGMGAHNCLASLRRYGFSYTVLGWGDAWGGWRHRMALYRDAAAAHAASPLRRNKLPVFCDAFDVVAARPWQGMTDAYKALTNQKKLVFGAERLCMGKSIGLPQLGLSNCGCVDDWWTFSKTPQTTPAIYLNNGLLAGPADAVHELYAWMLSDSRQFSDDQVGSKTYVNEHPSAALLDHTSILFKNLQHFDSLPNASTKSEAHTGAWFFHFPGSADVPQVFALGDAWKTHAGRLAVLSEPKSTARVANALGWILFALLCCALLGIGVWIGSRFWSKWFTSLQSQPSPLGFVSTKQTNTNTNTNTSKS